jgi:hypothetical protein
MRPDIQRWIGRRSSDVLGTDVVVADELDELVALVENGGGAVDWTNLELRLYSAGLNERQRREAIALFQEALGIHAPVTIHSGQVLL